MKLDTNIKWSGSSVIPILTTQHHTHITRIILFTAPVIEESLTLLNSITNKMYETFIWLNEYDFRIKIRTYCLF